MVLTTDSGKMGMSWIATMQQADRVAGGMGQRQQSGESRPDSGSEDQAGMHVHADSLRTLAPLASMSDTTPL